ncbi:MAG: MFS transporter [Chloroflexota bacterium]|nr:MFS transporter [Chloroflexota bacterium]
MSGDFKQMRPFFIIWGGQALSLLGSSLVQFSLVWWLTESTGSATVLATATMVAILPGIFIGPLAGALVDRWKRRWVMLVADAIGALATLGLAIVAWQGLMEPWHVYITMFVRALAGAFHWPAMQASTSLMVPDKHLSRVAGLNQTLHGAMNIVAPPMGALLLSLMSIERIMMIDVATAAFAIVPLLVIDVPQPPKTEEPLPADKPSVLADVKMGLRYVWSWPGLMIIMVMAMVINFTVNPAFTLLPILVVDNYDGTAWHLGGMEAAFGIGVVLGGLVLGAWGGFRKRVHTALFGLIGMGVGITMLGVLPAGAFILGMLALFIAGVMNPITNGPIMALMQAEVAPDMQGRVFTLLGSASMAMTPLSLAVAGPIADAFGVQLWYLLGGLTCIIMGVGAFFIPALNTLETNPNGKGTDQDTAPAVGTSLPVAEDQAS